jgi:hypothetical protein
MCSGVYPRFQTLIVETKKGKFTLCKDCYALYQSKKMSEDYETTKDNVKKFSIKHTDAYELIKEKEKFMKKIKEGIR